jgi:hypothetical protein
MFFFISELPIRSLFLLIYSLELRLLGTKSVILFEFLC